MTSAEAIQTRLAQLKPRLEQEYPVDELGIFGSYAWGDQRSDSDLDVLVIDQCSGSKEVPENATEFELEELEDASKEELLEHNEEEHGLTL